jgi:hypothetical protein
MLQVASRRGGSAGRGGTRWERTQDAKERHGRSVKTRRRPRRTASKPAQQQRRADGPAAVVPTATEQRAVHETVGMQEYLRYARLR